MKRVAFLLLVPMVAVAAPVPKETAEQKLAKLFGTPVDPKKDCEFKLDGTKLTLKVGKGDHALHAHQNRMAAPRTLREADGDFTVEATVSAEHPKEANPIVPNRNFLFHSQGLLFWVSDKTYIRFEQARIVNPGQEPVGYASYELFRDGEWTRAGTSEDGVLDPTKPASFRLTRKGNSVTGSWSQDAGKTWKELPALELDLKAKVHVGVVANHNTDAPFTATFEDFTITPLKK
jgi:regulation of enolase protein 1 (concanavalin A-like superfamily)